MPALSGSKNASFPAALPEPTSGTGAEGRTDAIAGMVVATAYCVLQVVLAIWHVPWLDEAQAWILATTLTNPLDLLILPGEGHPPLWYWLLRAISTVLDFDQARFLTTGVAVLNAWLLYRLLRGEVILLALMLFTFAVLQFWGYHFRPYPLVFTCLITALLCDRDNRPLAGTWALAVACGLHFFSGLFMAFWLIYQVSKGTRIVTLLPPAMVAAGFGLLAILSGLGNGTTGPDSGDLLADMLHMLAWPLVLEPFRGPVTALMVVAALVIALRARPLILITLLSLLTAFALGTALIYGRSPWHTSFMTMLCFMAVVLAGITPLRRWMLIVLLIPQVTFGVLALGQRFANPIWATDDLYTIVSQDAGAGFDPEQDLVAWPDVAAPEWAARYGIRMINGNNGALMDAIDWETHAPSDFDQSLLEMPRPFWLICYACDLISAHLEASGATLIELGRKYSVDNGESAAFRVE